MCRASLCDTRKDRILRVRENGLAGTTQEFIVCSLGSCERESHDENRFREAFDSSKYMHGEIHAVTRNVK
jgi:hypothetical protein